MSMTGVLRPGHVQIRVLDLDEALVHYKERLGLLETDRDAQGRVYLKGWDERDWFSVVLREADEPGMDFMAFKVDSAETLESLTQKADRPYLRAVCREGLQGHRHGPGQSRPLARRNPQRYAGAAFRSLLVIRR